MFLWLCVSTLYLLSWPTRLLLVLHTLLLSIRLTRVFQSILCQNNSFHKITSIFLTSSAHVSNRFIRLLSGDMRVPYRVDSLHKSSKRSRTEQPGHLQSFQLSFLAISIHAASLLRSFLSNNFLPTPKSEPMAVQARMEFHILFDS